MDVKELKFVKIQKIYIYIFFFWGGGSGWEGGGSG